MGINTAAKAFANVLFRFRVNEEGERELFHITAIDVLEAIQDDTIVAYPDVESSLFSESFENIYEHPDMKGAKEILKDQREIAKTNAKRSQRIFESLP
jgi:hypothetical protein